MAGTTARSKRMDLAFAALLSKDDEEVLAALTRIEAQGDARAVRPLLVALAHTPGARVRQRITSMLYQVKAPGAAEELFNALNEPELSTVRPAVLSTLWNAGIDVRGRLGTLLIIASTGSAEEVFECLTVIENQEVWTPEDLAAARTFVERTHQGEQDNYKGGMIAGLEEVLRRLLN